MKNWIKLFAVVASLAIAPSVLACERCFSPGSVDPVGNLISGSNGRCWSGYDTGYASCISSGYSCIKTVDSSCRGGGGTRGGKQQTWLRVGEPSAPASNCDVDVAGRCSAAPRKLDSFLR